jgi:hypothetical protein
MDLGKGDMSSVQSDAFVAAFDNQGSVLWSNTISGEGNDEEGDLYLLGDKLAFIGTTAGKVTVNGETKDGLGNLDICVASFTPDGSTNWFKIVGGAGDDEGSGILVYDPKSVFFCGSFNGTASFDNHSLTSAGSWDVVTGKLTSTSTGIREHNKDDDALFKLYPNPSIGTLFFESKAPDSEVSIYDLTGKQVCRNLFASEGTFSILLNCKAGLYFYKVSSADNYTTGTLIID